jgi:hypothetical protein
MALESISNMFIDEDTLSGYKEITFPWRARYIEIINDNASGELLYKFQESQDFATLKPLEAVTPRIKSYTLYLEGTGEYRIRAEG